MARNGAAFHLAVVGNHQLWVRDFCRSQNRWVVNKHVITVKVDEAVNVLSVLTVEAIAADLYSSDQAPSPSAKAGPP